MKKVLIIEDAAFIRRMLRSMLEKNNYRVVGEAENGLVGLDLFVARRPDVVLLDIVMPVMDGVECLKQLKKFDPNVNVVICSTVDDPKTVQDVFHLGIRDFITKPVREERLMKTLENICSGEEVVFGQEAEEKESKSEADDMEIDDYDINFWDI